MAGSGTSADPYIVSTWAEFKTYVCSNTGNSKYVKFAADIEPTGSDREGVTLTWSAKSVDGDGYSINNFKGVFQGSISSGCFYDVNNLNFINLDNRYNYLFSYGSSTTGGRNVNFKNCKFQGYTRASNFFNFGSVGMFAPQISRCAFNLIVGNAMFKISNSYSSSSYYGTIGNSNIRLTYEGVVPSQSNIFGASVRTRDCLLNVTDGNGGTITVNEVGDSIILGSNFTIANDSTTNMAGAVIYESDNITEGSITSTRIKPLTTAQIKDTSGSYLKALGFPI